MPDRRELTYEGGGLTVKLTLRAATVLDGMRRALLQGRAASYLDAQPENEANGLDMTARGLLVRILYPDLLACVVTASGIDQDMQPGEFLDLPEPFTDAWQNLVYELNPHWYPFRRESEAETEKNAVLPRSPSASDS